MSLASFAKLYAEPEPEPEPDLGTIHMVGPDSGSTLRIREGFSVKLLGQLANSGPTLCIRFRGHPRRAAPEERRWCGPLNLAPPR
jgi:hypothetical protein